MKRSSLPLISLLCIILFQVSCINKSVTPDSVGLSGDTLQLATKKMKEFTDNSKLAGISVLVHKNGATIYRQNFGYSNFNEKKPMGDSTIFRIFSMTKPVTAVALMTLFDEGKFKLDDNVSKYIPEFSGTMVYNAETKKLEPQIKEMTIRHLLTHTSGLTYGWDQKAYVDSLYRATGAGGWDGTIGEKVKIIAGLPLKFQPGTKWEYGL
jgi:CubicO group peptidase (beta-lactamase class C family)